MSHATVMAGIPATNKSLYHRVRFRCGDPTALATLPDGRTIFLLRDIELERARAHARAHECCSPVDYEPATGLSGDRTTATAQALAELLSRNHVSTVTADRTFPLIFAHHLQLAGIAVECDPEAGLLNQRAKDQQEIQWLRDAQAATEGAMRMVCELVARAPVDASGVLQRDGGALTSERMQGIIDIDLLERGYTTPGNIVACGPIGADCHNTGAGELFTNQPVIIDIFPCSRETGYNGDCTRTVVNGDVPDELAKMHTAVVRAKAAAIDATRASVTGEDVHNATAKVLTGLGYHIGQPPEGAPDSWCGMVHGTGHGIGLDVHEPPLLDVNGPVLIVGDALTIEPGLYCKAIGGVRIEDMVIITDTGCENLNSLHEGLDWS